LSGTIVGTATAFAGWCLAWVEQQLKFSPPSWGGAAPTAANAFSIYKSQGAQTFVPQAGDLAFFGPAPINGNAGHVGFVTSPGMFRSVLSSGKVVDESISEFSGANGAPFLGYISASKIGATVPADIAQLGNVGTAPNPPTTSGGVTNPPGIVGPIGSGIGTIGGAVGSVASGAGSAAQGAVQAVTKPLQGIQAVGAFFGTLWDFMTKRQNWWKLLFLLIAAVLIAVGLKAYFDGANNGQSAKSISLPNLPGGGKGAGASTAELEEAAPLAAA